MTATMCKRRGVSYLELLQCVKQEEGMGHNLRTLQKKVDTESSFFLKSPTHIKK